MTLTKDAYTRVTLALDIVKVLTDGPYRGFHELGTVKHRIDLCDTIGIDNAERDSVECDDPQVPRDGSNICLKAAAAVREKYRVDGHVRVVIRKRIPVMGGLAGGSADAAAMLDLLNELWGLRLGVRELTSLGRRLGMDVPYYFSGCTAFDTEAGGRLEVIDTACAFVFVLACPDFGVATREAYGNIDYASVGRRRESTANLLEALKTGDGSAAARFFHNDFEFSVLNKFPRCASLKQELLDAGCGAALLTGSGSTVFGLARDRAHAEEIRATMRCRTIIASTLSVRKPPNFSTRGISD